MDLPEGKNAIGLKWVVKTKFGADGSKETKVYKLRKALYRLKQAPRAWFMQHPSKLHFGAAKPVLRYIAGTMDYGICRFTVIHFYLQHLSHPSVGCFVTHHRWNSTLESLVLGIPVMCLLQFTYQPTNVKLLADEFKTGVRATKNDEGIVEGDDIKRCIELVMGDGEIGEGIRKNAKKWKYLAKDVAKEGGSSDKNLRTFVDKIEDGLTFSS
ncbi:hypothetical protein HYC85_019633 [Camellia sinensis]|uniref:Reverse transcriptase Ty1/copia-type domain-containing protein n=1 Tax=Camellia sinensis TaxID=4442 RepID=A0A7J7GQ19_CAMSI|nr:hypothetical protein HYC85_019633 [Camellia sinensis]